MTVLSALAGRHTALASRAVDHLHRLLGEWQLLADLSFADCLLFAPVDGRDAFVVLAQVRPYPAPTLYPDDMVGLEFPRRSRTRVAQAFDERRIVREGEPEWREGVPVREETIPVALGNEIVAVVSVEHNLAAARTPSRLELSYLRAGGALAQMIAEGTFPYAGDADREHEVTPRVGDGFTEIGPDGVVRYASPNAVSAYRRLGVTTDVIGESVAEIGVGRDILFELGAGHPVDDEIEEEGAWLLRRFLPIVHGGAYQGAVSLTRDITELRRRDRMLLLKDATIREIHHRVKNNLQMVASLLRLQSRRLGKGKARAELEESVRRISSIAVVHETLSQDASDVVEFDRVAQRVVTLVEDAFVRPDRPIRFTLEGTAGTLPSAIATPLSLILMELLQNAVEHAFPGRGGSITVGLKRTTPGVAVSVQDDGVGVPEDFTIEDASSLGLQIVRTLAKEMAGEIVVTSNGGTAIEVRVPVIG
ncbi:MAG TPA: sensor histidine kinase [Actinomycetota bacterium]